MNDTAVRTPQTALTVFLGAAPIVSVWLMRTVAGGAYLPDSTYPYAVLALLLVWSPLPFSLPAVVLGEARDMHRIQHGGGAWSLFKHLSSRESAVRSVFLASILGFAGAVLVALSLR